LFFHILAALSWMPAWAGMTKKRDVPQKILIIFHHHFSTNTSLMPNAEKNLSPEAGAERSRMEFIDGHPVCGACLSGNHEHPMTEEAQKEKRSDCKNTGKIGGQEYQCHCGHGGWCEDKKWQTWDEDR
jgi:hypothetical protein